MIYKFFKKGEKVEGKELVSLINSMFDTQLDYARRMQDRITFRNILYYTGEQWLSYIQSIGSFRRRQIPSHVPTPVSNEIRDFVRSVRAMLLTQNLVPKIRPNTNEKEDEKASELGEKLLTWMDTLRDEEIEGEKEKVSDWMSLSGTAFLRTIPDMEAGDWFMGKSGEVIKTGDVITRNIIPFNVYLDDTGENLRDKRWIGIASLVPKEWVEDTFNVTIGEETIKAENYQKRLMKLVSQVSQWKGHGLESSMLEVKGNVIFKEVEIRPSSKYPNGRYLVSCADTLIRDVPRMPIKVKNGTWYYTLTDFHYNRVPGRFWSDAGINDLISPQNHINEIDQSLELNRKGIGRPRIITPGEIALKRLSEAGQGFLVLKYDPLLSGGQAPKIESGTPLPQQVLAERDIAKIQIQDSSGDPKNILKGQSPGSKASGVMVDILRETAEKGHSPDLNRYNRGMSIVYKKRLLLAKEVYTETRMIKAVGRSEKINVIPFKGSDLRDNTDVRLELDSGLSTTKAGQRQILLDLAQYQVLDMQDPEVRQEYLKRLGLTGFSAKLNVDIERAEEENSKVAVGDIDQIMIINENDEIEVNDPLFKYDRHDVHYEIHRKFILSADFRALPEKAQVVLIAHTDIHHELMQQEQVAQAELEAESESKGSKTGVSQSQKESGGGGVTF